MEENQVAAAPVEAQATEAQAPEAQAPQKQYVDPESLEKFIKVKVDGQEIEMPLKEAVRIQSLESASWKRLHEATKKSKELERKAKEFEEMDPREYLKRRGIDPKEFSAKELEQAVEEMNLSESERELRDLRKQMAEIKNREETQKKKQEEELRTKQEQEEFQKYQREFDESFTKALTNSGLPKHPFFARQAASIMEEALQHDIDLTPEEAVVMMKRRTFDLIPSLLEALDDESFEGVVGKKNLERARKKMLAKVSAKDDALDGSEPKRKASTSSGDEPAFFKSQSEYRKFYGMDS